MIFCLHKNYQGPSKLIRTGYYTPLSKKLIIKTSLPSHRSGSSHLICWAVHIKGQLISKRLFPKNERNNSIIVLFVRSFFGRIVGLKKTLRLCLTLSGSTTRYQLKSTEFKYILERIQWIQWRSYLLQRVKTLAKMLRGGPFLLVVKKSVNSI